MASPFQSPFQPPHPPHSGPAHPDQVAGGQHTPLPTGQPPTDWAVPPAAFGPPPPHFGSPLQEPRFGYAPGRIAKPPMPGTIVGAMLLSIAGIALGTLLGLGVNSHFSWWLLVGVSALPVVAFVAVPGKASRMAMTITAGLWSLTIVGAIIGIPTIILLWRSDSTAYFLAGERRLNQSNGRP